MAGGASCRPNKAPMSDQKKPGNLRTALILLSVAVAFFIGVIIKHTMLR